jgi:hypothetical protein
LRATPRAVAHGYEATREAAMAAFAKSRRRGSFWSLTMPYITRKRRLSSITRAPCRKVMGVPGQRWHAV